MRQERDREVEARRAEQQRKIPAVRERRQKIAGAKARLFALFGEINPQRRRKKLEGALNELFRAYGALVAEDFKRNGPDAGLKSKPTSLSGSTRRCIWSR